MKRDMQIDLEIFSHTKKKERIVRDSAASHMTPQPLVIEEETSLIQSAFSFLTAVM